MKCSSAARTYNSHLEWKPALEATLAAAASRIPKRVTTMAAEAKAAAASTAPVHHVEQHFR